MKWTHRPTATSQCEAGEQNHGDEERIKDRKCHKGGGWGKLQIKNRKC